MTRKHAWEAKDGERLYRGWYIWRGIDAGWVARRGYDHFFSANSFAEVCDEIDKRMDNV